MEKGNWNSFVTWQSFHIYINPKILFNITRHHTHLGNNSMRHLILSTITLCDKNAQVIFLVIFRGIILYHHMANTLLFVEENSQLLILVILRGNSKLHVLEVMYFCLLRPFLFRIWWYLGKYWKLVSSKIIK